MGKPGKNTVRSHTIIPLHNGVLGWWVLIQKLHVFFFFSWRWIVNEFEYDYVCLLDRSIPNV